MKFLEINKLWLAGLLALVSVSVLNADPNVPNSGGYNSSLDEKKSQVIKLKQIKDDIEAHEKKLAKILERSKQSKARQKQYLLTLKKFSRVVDGYIKSKGRCITLEDKYTLKPARFEKNRLKREEEVEECYEQADRELGYFGSINTLMNNTYLSMLEIREAAEGDLPVLESINKALPYLKSNLDFMEKEG
jgi:polyribonucleotide nucleotidyltransferase